MDAKIRCTKDRHEALKGNATLLEAETVHVGFLSYPKDCGLPPDRLERELRNCRLCGSTIAVHKHS